MWRIVRRVGVFVKVILTILRCKLENASHFLADGRSPYQPTLFQTASCKHGSLLRPLSGTSNLNHIVPSILGLHEIGDGVAVKKFIDHMI